MPVKTVPTDDTAHGSQAEFLRFLPLAQTIPADEVLPMRFDPELAYYNLRVGVEAVLPYREELALDLPRLDLQRLFVLPELGQAVVFAASQAATDAGTSGPSLRVLIQEGQQLRGLLLLAADTLVAFDCIPGSTVAKIRAGHGFRDAARDLGDLAALHTKYSTEFRQKTPATAAQARRAAELGAELLSRMSPRGARRGLRAVTSEATMARDRLATLLVRCHRDLRRVGYWIWGEDYDTHVPALQSRVRARKKAPTQPEPKPKPEAPAALT